VWGGESARWAVAQGLMGDAEQTAYGMSNREGLSSFDQDGVFADRFEPDEHARVALELMVAFDIPLGVLLSADRSGHRVVEAPPAGLPPVDTELHADARFNLLDHRIAARLQAGPYSLADLPDEVFDLDDPAPFVPPGADIQRHDPMTLDTLRMTTGVLCWLGRSA